MCLLCIEIAKERMTVGEARRALNEMVATANNEQMKKHYEELAKANDGEIKKIAEEAAKSLS